MEIGKKQKFSPKTIVSLTLFTVISYTLIVLVSNYFFGVEKKSTTSYIYQIVFFTVVMMVFIIWVIPLINQRLIKNVQPKLTIGEEVAYEGLANLRMNPGRVVGKLFFTNQRVYYQPRKMMGDTDLLSLPYNEIQKVEKCKTSFIVDSSLKIITKGEEEYIFNVYDRDTWFEKLNEQINKYAPQKNG